MSAIVKIQAERDSDETESAAPDYAESGPFQTAAEFDAAHSKLLSRLGKRDAKTVQSLVPEIKALLERGSAGGAYIHEPAERRACQAIVDFWVTQSYSVGFDVGARVLAEHDEHLLPILKKPCPYLGLKAFSEEEKQYFFGRDSAIKDLLSRLQQSNFVMVTGASGSGKSSLVLAGLLPALRAGGVEGSKNWNYLPAIVPGSDPIKRLAECIVPEGRDKAAWIKEQSARLTSDPNHLTSVLKTLSLEPTVLVVDQFEEIFTLATEDNEKSYRAFVAGLLGVIRSKSPRHRVIVTVRQDFVPKLALYPELHALHAGAVFPLIEMDQVNLRHAVEGPAARIGLKFQKGVVDELLGNMVGEETNLPLLQFALTSLWKQRHGNLITRDSLKALGNIKAAIADAAQAVFESLPPAEQSVANRVFLKLTRTSDGPAVLRNRVARGELLDLGEAAVLQVVLDRFSDANLIRITKAQSGKPEEDLVEVVHESLLRNWQHLTTLLVEQSDKRERRVLLRKMAEEWRDKRFDRTYLLVGLALKDVQETFDRAQLSEIEQRFLSASEEHERSRLRQRSGIVALLAILCAGLSGLGLWNLSIISDQKVAIRDKEKALVLRDDALRDEAAASGKLKQALKEKSDAVEEQDKAIKEQEAAIADRDEAFGKEQRANAHLKKALADLDKAVGRERIVNSELRSRDQGRDALKMLEQDPLLALAAAKEAFDRGQSSTAAGAMYSALRASWQRTKLPGRMGGNDSEALVLSPDGSTAFVAYGPTVRKWATESKSASSPTLELRGERIGGGNIVSLAMNADGSRIAGGTENGWLYVWNAESGDLLYRRNINPPRSEPKPGTFFRPPTAFVHQVAFGSDKQSLAAVIRTPVDPTGKLRGFRNELIGWLPLESEDHAIQVLKGASALVKSVNTAQPPEKNTDPLPGKVWVTLEDGAITQATLSRTGIELGPRYQPECASARDASAGGGGRHAILSNARICYWGDESVAGRTSPAHVIDRTAADIILSEDGKRVAELNRQSKSIVIRNMDTGLIITSLPGAFDLERPGRADLSFWALASRVQRTIDERRRELIRFSGDGKVLAVLRAEGGIGVYDIAAERGPWRMLPLPPGRTHHNANATLVALIPDSKKDEIHIYDRSSVIPRIFEKPPRKAGNPRVAGEGYAWVAFTPDERYLVADDGRYNELYVIDLKSNFTTQTFEYDSAQHGDNGVLFRDRVGVIRSPDGKSLYKSSLREAPILSPDGSRFAIRRAAEDGASVEIFTVRQGTVASELRIPISPDSRATADAPGRFLLRNDIMFDRTGRVLLVERGEGRQTQTDIWEIESKRTRPAATISGLLSGVIAVGGTRLLVASRDTDALEEPFLPTQQLPNSTSTRGAVLPSLVVVDLAKGTSRESKGRFITSSSHGKYLVRLGQSGGLEVVDSQKLEKVANIPGSPQVRLSPNDRYLAAVYVEQNLLALYDLDSKEKLIAEISFESLAGAQWIADDQNLFVRTGYGVEVIPTDLGRIRQIAAKRLER